jgi:hypothetical protein
MNNRRPIGHRVFVDIEVINGNRVFRNFILEQLRDIDIESLYKAGNLGGIDSHLGSVAAH